MSIPIRNSQSTNHNPVVSLIVAMSRNRVIGRGNQLPWRMPADLKRFKSVTMDHAVIMGRRTFDSIGRKPLPGRTNIVITRDFKAKFNGALAVTNLDQAIAVAAQRDAETHCKGEIFILGGSEIFGQAMPMASRIHLTLIDAEIDGDTFFPEIDRAAWRMTADEAHAADERHQYPYRFQVYER